MTVRRALIIFLGALLVSVLAAATMIGFAALTKSLVWSVIGAVLIGILASWLVGILIWRRVHALRRAEPSDRAEARPLRRLVIGPLVVLACAVLLSLTWLYPGLGSVRPDPVPGVEWLDLPDGSRLALHVTRASAASRPPIIFVHGGPGVATWRTTRLPFPHWPPIVTSMSTTGSAPAPPTRLADPMGYTTAREVNDLEAVRARTGAPQVVLIGHSWGARFVAAYAQEHPDRVAALVLTAPGDLPLEGAEVPPGDLTTRLDTSELVKEY